MGALLAGLAASGGQAPLGLWPLTLIGLALLVAMVAAQTPRRAAMLAWAGGTGYFLGSLFWIVSPFMVEPWRHGWMAPFALVLTAAGLALFWGAAGWIAARIGPTRASRALAFALALAGAELTRSYALTGFPWALLGHVWIDTPVAQAAALVGPVGLTILTVLAAALPTLAAGARGRSLGGAASVALLAAVWIMGAMRLAAPEPVSSDPARIRIIQPNAAQHLKWRLEMAEVFLDRQLRLTATPPAGGARKPDLVIWPEASVAWLLNRPGVVLELIAGAAGGAPVALGINRSDGPRYYNSLAVIGPDAEIRAVYDKFHLVPFGEYVPFGDLLADWGIRAFAAREGNGYTAGPGARTIDLGGALGRIQPLICYEAVFPQDINAAPERPDWLLQVTNDGWFGEISGPYQHLAQARLRAIEQGLPLLRSANTGVSAVIDAKGRVLQSLPLGAEGFLDADLPPPLPVTAYARTGDWPAGLLILAGLLTLLLARPFTRPSAVANKAD